MFKTQVVKNCPVTRASQGRVILPPWLIADIVGTLEREKGQEWLIFLHGSRSEDGFEVVIDRITIPQDQKRHSTEVEVGDSDKIEDVLGVLHSHHSMKAQFSHTDDTKLNPRFDISIVVSENLPYEESTWLGFSYEAEGGVKLPCGAKGRVPFFIQPEGVDDWPLDQSPRVDSEDGDLGDCCNVQSTYPLIEVDGKQVEDRYHWISRGKCDMTSAETQPAWKMFGSGTEDIHKALPKPIPNRAIYGGWKPQTPTTELPGYASTEPKLLSDDDSGWDNQIKCSNCGFYEHWDDLELIGSSMLCERCLLWATEPLEPIQAGGHMVDEEVEWEERWAQLLIKEYGGGV
jgi:proteasome lid subunit RPN8/RPN11